MTATTTQPSTAMQRINLVAVGVVAIVAAVISYAHMQDLAFGAGEGWRSHLLPLSVDGLLVAATTSILVARWRGHRAGWVAQLSLALGIAASIAANIAAAEPTLEGRLIAAWPPLALALATELLAQQGRHTKTKTDTEIDSAADTAPAGEAATGEQDETPDAEPAEPDTPADETEAAQTDTPTTTAPDSGDTPRRATRRRAPRTASPARAGNGEAREKARALFEQALADGRADEMTGTQLAQASGAHPGSARKWLATWRAEHANTPDPHTADTTSDQHDEHTHPTRAEEVAA